MKLSNFVNRTKIKFAEIRSVISDASRTNSSSAIDTNIVTLEERIMLSATPLPVDAVPADSPDQDANQSEESTSAQNVQREIIFVDAGVEDVDLLLEGVVQGDDLNREFEFIFLDENQDGIEQITNFLANRSDIDAIHILSHGSAGEVNLGNTVLNNQTIDAYAGQLAQWADSLTTDADILFYGCNLAATDSGEEFVESVAALTGADVAASDDLTGHADLGGNWEFEFVVGTVSADVVFSVDARENWEGTLETVSVDVLADVVNGDTSSVSALHLDDGGDGISLREAIIAVNNGSGGQTILLGAGIHTLTIAGTGDAGGDLDINQDVVIIGSTTGATVIDASGLMDTAAMTGERVFSVFNNSATFQHLTITGGYNTAGGGGGILVANNGEAIVDNVVVTGNHSTANGGGIASTGTLTVTNSTISSNTALNGGGISTSGNQPLQLNNVTVSGNEAANEGGGVYIINGSQNLTNVTLSGNEANDGGGIAVVGTRTTANLTNLTIVDNTARDEGGGIFNRFNQADVNVAATIVAGNMAMFEDDVSGDIDEDNNSITSGGTDMLLEDLADNGGPVQTHALLSVSAAIDLGGMATADETDARGFLVADGTRDLGAFEANAISPTGRDNMTPTNIAPESNTQSTPVTSNPQSFSIGGSDVDGTVAQFRIISVPDDGTLSSVINGDLAAGDIITAFNGGTASLQFTPNATWDGSSSFQFAAIDNEGVEDPTPAVRTLTGTPTTSNDAPESLNSTDFPDEDTSSFVELHGSDVDGTVESFRIVTLPGDGTLYTDSSMAIEVVAGTVYPASVVGVGGTLYFVPDADFSGLTTFRFAAIDDLGAEDPTPGLQVINVQAINDAPTFSNLGPNVAFTEDGSPVIIDNDVVLFDAELQASGNYNGATLSIARAGGAQPEDVLSNSGLLEPLVQGNDLVYNDETVGSVILKVGGQLIVEFNSNATDAVVNGVAQSITYSNSNDAPPANVDLEWSFNDQSTTGGGSLAGMANIEVNITAVNDAPTVDLDGATTGVNFNTIYDVTGSAISLVNTAFLDDVDSTIQTLTVTLTNTPNGTDEVLGFTRPPSLSSLASATSVRFNNSSGTATNADFLAVLNSLTYENTAADPDRSDRVITVIANDGTAQSEVATVVVSFAGDATPPTVDTNTGSTVDEGGVDLIQTIELQSSDNLQPASALTYTISGEPANGHIANLSDTATAIASFTQTQIDGNQIVYVHDGSETTSDSFEFEVDDDQGNTTTTQTFDITVNPVNDTPTANAPGTLTVFEQFGLSLDGAGFSLGDVDSGTSQIQVVFSATEGVVATSIGNSGVQVSNAGTTTITGTVAQISDLLAGITTGFITYQNNSDAPSATATLTMTVNDLGNTGADPNLTGDATSEEATTTTTINITPLNDLPDAVDDSFATNEDTPYTATLNINDLLQNDSDPDGDTLTVDTTPVSGPNSGTLNLNSDGTFTYTPNADFHGTDSFEYEVSDASGATAQARVDITVNAINDQPVIAAGSTATLTSVQEDTSGFPGHSVADIINQIGGITDVDGPAEGIAIFGTDSANGNWEYSIDGGTTWLDLNSASPTNTRLLDADSLIRFEPTVEDFTGTATFFFRAWDQSTGSVGESFVQFQTISALSDFTATAEVTVTAVNDAPMAGDDDFTTNEDTAFSATLGANDLLLNDSDIDNDILTVNTTPVSGPTNGTLALNADGTFTYTPNANFNGTDSFRYQISDGNGESAEATVTITVNPVNDAPTNSPVALSAVLEDTVRIITEAELLASAGDVEGDALSVTGLASSGNGTLVDNGNGTWTFTPAGDDDSVVIFSYEVTDGTDSVVGLATLDILPVNDAPVVNLTNLTTTLAENTPTPGAIKVADIVVTDDGDGINTLSLTGDDASLFEIVGNELRLRAGTILDFESHEQLDVTVAVDDSTVGTGIDSSANHRLLVTDENEAPTVSLANILSVIPLGTDPNESILVANIIVTDDALGDTTLSLTGENADLFEINGNQLWLRPGNTSDFAVPVRRVIVHVDDPTLGGGVDNSASFEVDLETVTAAPSPDTTTDQETSPDSPSDETENDNSESQDDDLAMDDISTIGTPVETGGAPSNPTDVPPQQDNEIEVIPVATELTDLVVQSRTIDRSSSQFVLPNYGVLSQTVASGDLALASFTADTSGPISQFALSFSQLSDWAPSAQESLNFEQIVVGTSAITTTSLSVGYVVWLLRGGSLLASLATSLPAWTSFDPLPIVNQFNEKEDCESLADIASKTDTPNKAENR